MSSSPKSRFLDTKNENWRNYSRLLYKSACVVNQMKRNVKALGEVRVMEIWWSLLTLWVCGNGHRGIEKLVYYFHKGDHGFATIPWTKDDHNQITVEKLDQALQSWLAIRGDMQHICSWMRLLGQEAYQHWF